MKRKAFGKQKRRIPDQADDREDAPLSDGIVTLAEIEALIARFEQKFGFSSQDLLDSLEPDDEFERIEFIQWQILLDVRDSFDKSEVG